MITIYQKVVLFTCCQVVVVVVFCFGSFGLFFLSASFSLDFSSFLSFTTCRWRSECPVWEWAGCSRFPSSQQELRPLRVRVWHCGWEQLQEETGSLQKCERNNQQNTLKRRSLILWWQRPLLSNRPAAASRSWWWWRTPGWVSSISLLCRSSWCWSWAWPCCRSVDRRRRRSSSHRS